ncbi:MAG: bacterial transcriptional activator domain-containing protein [Gemmatimonadaceae bacterium]
MPGNTEFERWADAHRQQRRDQIIAVLHVLADQARDAGNLTTAIERRRRLLTLDPLDSCAAYRLIELLSATGNLAGAIRQLEMHESLIRRELDIPLPSELVELRRALIARPSGPVERPGAEVLPAPELPITVETQRRPTRSDRNTVLRVAAAAGLVAVIAGGLTFQPPQPPAPALFDRQVVVAPFRVSGADPSLGFLRDGLVELISIRLGGDSAVQPLDPGGVLRAWRRAGLADGETERGEFVRVAGALGARGLVTGSVVGDARHIVVSASVVDVGDTTRRVMASADGPLDSLSAIVDRLAGRLLIGSAGETERFTRTVTPSPVSLRAFLDGLALYRAGAYAHAARRLEQALHADSTFALAAFQLALSADRINASEQHDRALSLAWTYREELGERDRLHLTAFAGPRYPSPSTETEQLAAWEALVARSPDRAEALVELAGRFVRSGRLLGALHADRRAAALLGQALRIDPDAPSARALLLLTSAHTGDTSLVTTQMSGPRARRGFPAWAEWRGAIALGDSQALRRVRASMASLSGAELSAIGRLSQFDASSVEDGERALALKRLRARRGSDQVDAILAQHSLALNRGRPTLALDLTEQLEEAQPGLRAHLRLRVLDALYGGGDSAAAAVAAARLAPIVDAAPSEVASMRALQLADACVLAQWRIATSELSSVRRTISALRSAGVPRDAVPIGANPHTCAALLDASLTTMQQPRRALGRVVALDSLMLGGPAANDAGAYAHLLLARLYERLGKPDRALAAIRRRPYLDGWPRYLATARREEGRLAIQVGDRDGSLRAYGQYLVLRNAPEPFVATEVAEVRAAEAGARQSP